MSLNAVGGQQYGQRSVLQQVEDFISCAHQNLHLFCPPKLNIIFHHGVPSAVAQSVERRGAKVFGSIVDFDQTVHGWHSYSAYDTKVMDDSLLGE